jgi:hypothetical protein
VVEQWGILLRAKHSLSIREYCEKEIICGAAGNIEKRGPVVELEIL